MNNHFNSFQFAALLPSLSPLRLMLADTSSPRGSDATLASVGTLSEGFERFVASPLYLVGYVRWDAQSDQYLLCQTIIPTAFRSQNELPTIAPRGRNSGKPVEQLRSARLSKRHSSPLLGARRWPSRSCLGRSEPSRYLSLVSRDHLPVASQ